MSKNEQKRAKTSKIKDGESCSTLVALQFLSDRRIVDRCGTSLGIRRADSPLPSARMVSAIFFRKKLASASVIVIDHPSDMKSAPVQANTPQSLPSADCCG